MARASENKSSKKRRRDDIDEDAGGPNGVIDARLAAHGERFMQLFEPTETDAKAAAASSEDPESSEDYPSGSETGSDGGNAVGAVEQIFDARSRVKPAARKPKVNAAVPIVDPKLERKRFMSHKAHVVSGATFTAAPTKKQKRSEVEAVSGGLSKQEFLKLQREVNQYGATALDKKSRKKFDAAMLEEIGAKKEKGVKVSAKIGIGMATKQKKRDAVALEEAIASGMVKKKGMGKKKREEKRNLLDKGLMEDSGAFKGGVLRVRKTTQAVGGKGGGSFRKGSKR